jgi:hypothetical protein
MFGRLTDVAVIALGLAVLIGMAIYAERRRD